MFKAKTRETREARSANPAAILRSRTCEHCSRKRTVIEFQTKAESWRQAKVKICASCLMELLVFLVSNLSDSRRSNGKRSSPNLKTSKPSSKVQRLQKRS
jgi:superfamily II helicase